MWDKQQVKQFVADAKREFGPGWQHLGPRFQKAIICEAALSVVATASARLELPAGIAGSLRAAMLAEAGL